MDVRRVRRRLAIVDRAILIIVSARRIVLRLRFKISNVDLVTILNVLNTNGQISRAALILRSVVLLRRLVVASREVAPLIFLRSDRIQRLTVNGARRAIQIAIIIHVDRNGIASGLSAITRVMIRRRANNGAVRFLFSSKANFVIMATQGAR